MNLSTARKKQDTRWKKYPFVKKKCIHAKHVMPAFKRVSACRKMKIMIDRLLPKWQSLGGKDAYVVITGHDGKGGLKRNAEDLVGILENLGDRVCQVIWGEHVWQKSEVIGTKAMEEADLAGKRI